MDQWFIIFSNHIKTSENPADFGSDRRNLRVYNTVSYHKEVGSHLYASKKIY
jgi:hypothetical protein